MTSQTQVRADPSLKFTVVWTPLPPITWILPFIGHTGIADSRGVVNDFQGPYYVGDRGKMAFGNPTRALNMTVEDLPGRCGNKFYVHVYEIIFIQIYIYIITAASF